MPPSAHSKPPRSFGPRLAAAYTGVESGIQTTGATAAPFEVSGTINFEPVAVPGATTAFYLATYSGIPNQSSSVLWNAERQYFILAHGGTVRSEFIYPTKTKCVDGHRVVTEMVSYLFGKTTFQGGGVSPSQSTVSSATYKIAK